MKGQAQTGGAVGLCDERGRPHRAPKVGAA